MKTIEMNWHTLCYDAYGIENKSEMRDFLESEHLQDFLSHISQSVILVLGGDGTMLRAIRENYEKKQAFLWINFWHKWFLLNNKEWISHLPQNFVKRSYPLIEISRDDTRLWIGFNDVNIYSPNGKVLSLDIKNSFWSLGLHGDGVIVSTPAGSTGHSKSYGWPVLLHDTRWLIITPKWNLTPQSPKTINDSHPIVVENTGKKFELSVNIDGGKVLDSQYEEDIRLEISKSKEHVELLIAQDHEMDWDNKLMPEQGFNS